MRVTILLAIMGVLILAALYKPKIGLWGYVWFAVLRPDYLAWSAGHYPISMLLAVATLIGTLIHRPTSIPRVFSSPITNLVILLQVPCILSAVFAVDPRLTFSPLYLYWKVVLMSLLIIVLMETKEDLIILSLVIGGSLGLLSGKMGLAGILSGGSARFAQGYGGMLSDNNTYAMALAMGLPICWYLRDLVKPIWMKWGLLAVVFLTVPGVLMTYSRGVAVAMAAGLAMIGFRSKHRIVMIVGLVITGGVMMSYLGAGYSQRISTVLKPSSEGSANSRFVFAKAALKMAADYPVLGVGFGETNQQRLFGRYTGNVSSAGLVIHNTYLQVLVDSGIFAFLLFTGVIGLALWRLQLSYMRLKKLESTSASMSLMFQTTLAVYAVNALVLSHASFDLFYMILIMSATWLNIEQAEYAPGQVASTAPSALSRILRRPLSERPMPVPVSRQQTDSPLSRRQPSQGIATTRQAEMRSSPPNPGLAP